MTRQEAYQLIGELIDRTMEYAIAQNQYDETKQKVYQFLHENFPSEKE